VAYDNQNFMILDYSDNIPGTSPCTITLCFRGTLVYKTATGLKSHKYNKSTYSE